MVAKTDSGFEYPDDQEYASMVFEDAGELTINLADVKELKFENVPKGRYVAEVDESEYGMSQSSGSPMIKFVFKIAEGEYAGRKMPSWLSFSPKALPGTKANLNRIAPELVSQAFQPRKLCDEGYFIGRKVQIVVGLGEYNGEQRSQIKGFNALVGQADGGFVS
jgi:hypothetical protein